MCWHPGGRRRQGLAQLGEGVRIARGRFRVELIGRQRETSGTRELLLLVAQRLGCIPWTPPTAAWRSVTVIPRRRTPPTSAGYRIHFIASAHHSGMGTASSRLALALQLVPSEA